MWSEVKILNCRKKLYADALYGKNGMRYKLTVKTKDNQPADTVKKILKSSIGPTDMKIGIRTHLCHCGNTSVSVRNLGWQYCTYLWEEARVEIRLPLANMLDHVMDPEIKMEILEHCADLFDINRSTSPTSLFRALPIMVQEANVYLKEVFSILVWRVVEFRRVFCELMSNGCYLRAIVRALVPGLGDSRGVAFLGVVTLTE
jgi:hypothetical protein